MNRVLLTPIDLAGPTRRIGKRTYVKQILPLGSITYKGRKINFDKAFLTDLAASFKSKAYDQVPLIFADSENRHNMDPRNFGGEVQDIRLAKDGLYGVIKVTPETDKVLKANPRLGVSARIVQALDKADGRKYKRALNHVLLTMDPRVTGMKGWRTVDLSVYTEGDQVVDLTAEQYEEEAMPKKATSGKKATAKPEQTGPLDLSNLSDEEFDALLSDDDVEADEVEDDEEDEEVDESTDSGDTEDEEVEDEDEEDEETNLSTPTKPAKRTKATAKARRPKAKAKTKARAKVDLAEDDDDDVDLAEDTLDSTDRDQITQMRIDLAAERWKGERKEYVRSGVPPFLLDLAEPILSSPDNITLDLSNADEPVDATQVLRDVLAGVKGLIDLTPEIGHQMDLSEDEGQDQTKALLDQWDEEYGTA